MQSSMFLTDVTVLDHGYIDGSGFVKGGSYHPSFIVTGEIDPEEKVVVDFSAIKKAIKSLIDDKDTGYDHKTWIIEDYSNIESITPYVDEDGIDMIDIITPNTHLRIPRSAIKLVKRIENEEPFHDQDYIAKSLESYLTEKLSAIYPQTSIKIQCVNRCNEHSFSPFDSTCLEKAYFSYTHGLRASTSWGCQNIGHGHLSYIQANVLDDYIYRDTFTNTLYHTNEIADLLDLIVEDIDNAVFIDKANVDSIDDTGVQISYKSRDRGNFYAKYSPQTKVIILDTETTIEYIVEYVVEKYRDEFKRLNINTIFVSEGLSKGAVGYV